MSASSEIKSQLINPGHVLDLLLLVGADVVRVALAQLTGSRWPAPAVFSFGWVTYTFDALVSIIGDKRLMPPPDVQSIIINAKTGYVRNNRCRALGRLLRDFEDGHWMDPEIERRLRDMLDPTNKPEPSQSSSEPIVKRLLKRFTAKPRDMPKAGLCISIYEADPDRKAKDVMTDKLFWAGYAVAILQPVIAALPWIVYEDGEYMTFVFTLGGNFLAFAMGSFRQWRREQFGCRKATKTVSVLTRGNGAQHALVILGHGRGLNLEDLATSGEGEQATMSTITAVFSFTILWVVILICVDGLGIHTWFLVAVGSLGSVYTSLVAGLQRRPENFGIPLRYTGKCIMNRKGMLSLMEAEEYKSGLGRSMLETFFPGSRSDAEEEFWNEAKRYNDLIDPPFEHAAVTEAARRGAESFRRKIKMLRLE